MNNEQAVTIITGENVGRVRHSEPAETGSYDDALARAGQIANQMSAADAFSSYHQQITANTKRRQHNDLESFSAYLQDAGISRSADDLYHDAQAWRGMQHGIVRGFVRWLANAGYAIGSINVRLATIRQYCTLAGPEPVGAGMIDTDDLAAILTVKGYNDKVGRNLDQDREHNGQLTRRGHKKAQATELSTSQALRLKKTTTKTARSRPHDRLMAARDALLVGLLIEHALRCSEVVALNVEQIDLDEGTVSIYRQKTNETSTHRMKQHTRAAAEMYLAEVGRKEGPLFTGYGDTRIATRTVNARIATLGQQLGVEKLSPHDLRHFWAFDAFRNGTPLDRVKSGGGWKTVEMPMRYARRTGIDNEGVKITEEE
jgi:integrase